MRTVACICICVLTLFSWSSADVTNAYMSRPNRESGVERLLGFGVVMPYPYFQKPMYRYPVYDRNGKGSLVYGYGGSEVFQYKQFTPIDGHH